MSFKSFYSIILFAIIAATLEYFFPRYGIIFCLLVMILLMITPRTNLQAPSDSAERKAVRFLLDKANKQLNKATEIFNEFKPDEEEFEVK